MQLDLLVVSATFISLQYMNKLLRPFSGQKTHFFLCQLFNFHSYSTSTLCPTHLPVTQRNGWAVELSWKLSSFFLNLAYSPDSCPWLETVHTFRHLLFHLWTGLGPCCQVSDCASQEQVLCWPRRWFSFVSCQDSSSYAGTFRWQKSISPTI